MKKLMKKAVSLLLATIMLVGCAPLGALGEFDFKLPDFSVHASAAKYGICGDNITYTLTVPDSDEPNTYCLTLEGEGDMYNYGTSSSDNAPWFADGYLIDIRTVVIGSGITSIGTCAFKLCNGLTEVRIAPSVKKICDSAFDSCTSLSKVNFIAGSSLETIEKNAFNSCESLKSITLPSKVTSIGFSAFAYCTSLKSVTLSRALVTIGIRAFFDCSALTAVTIPAKVETISDYAFAGCTSLSSINVASGNTAFSSDDGILFDATMETLIKYPINKTTHSRYDIPDNVQKISPYAFEYNTTLTYVHVSKYIHTIGDQAFFHCTNLTNIDVEDSSPFFESDDDTGALYRRDRNSLVLVPPGSSRNPFVVPDNITEIENYALFGCNNIKRIRIEKNVTLINKSGYSMGYYDDHGSNVKYSDFLISCYMDSAAQIYAVNNGIAYELIDKPWDGSVAEAFAGGSGAASDPYIIETAQQLALMAGLINGTVTSLNGSQVSSADFIAANYRMCADINLNNTIDWTNWQQSSPERAWTPISNFSGTFDGDGHCINGLYISGAAGTDNIGLVAQLNGEIKNLGVSRSVLEGEGENVGAIAAVVSSSGKVTNCYAYANVYAESKAGGIVGANAGAIEKCYFASATASNNAVSGIVECSADFAGGIAGENSGAISNCFNVATVIANKNVGGITGGNTGTVERCYNIGAVISGCASDSQNQASIAADTAAYDVGAIAGSNTGTVEFCYYVVGSASGGVDSEDNGASPVALADMNEKSSFEGFDFSTGGVWRTLRNGYIYPSISGSYALAGLPVFYEISAVQGENGTVSSKSVSVPINGSYTFTVTPERGYSISNIFFNGVPLNETYGESETVEITVENISKECTFACYFAPNTYVAVFDPGNGTFKNVSSLNEDGSKSVPTLYGATPRQPAKPVPNDTNEVFDGWEPTIVPMSDSTVRYTAKYRNTHEHIFIFDHIEKADCLTDGVVVTRCACGDENRTTIHASGQHNWDEEYTVDIPADCDDYGSQSIHCAGQQATAENAALLEEYTLEELYEKCDAIDETTVQSISPLGHDCTEWHIDKAASCTLGGIKSMPCKRENCDYVSKENTVIEPLGHNYEGQEYITDVNPTCTAAGNEYIICKECHHRTDRTISPLGHDWETDESSDEVWHVTTPATCTTKGVEERACRREGCDKVETRAIAILPHNYVETVTAQPSCTAVGIKQSKCSVCGNTITTELPITHSLGEVTVDVEATCVSPGLQSKHCTVCDGRFEVTEISKKSHSFGAWQTVRAASETQRGIEKCVCSLCGAEQVRLTGTLNANFSVAAITAKAYTGKPVCPKVSVTAGSSTLKEGVDYYVDYYSNIDVGTAYAVVTGMDNYAGSVASSFSVVRANISAAVFTAPASVVANNLPEYPELYATFDGIYIEQDKDYTCAYSNNVTAGTATITVSGIGNFTGTKTVTFKILGNSLPFVARPIDAVDYIGTQRAPEITLAASADNKTLVSGTDYTVAYTNNINAGYATAVVTGKGSYGGTLTLGFVIKPRSISAVTAPVIANQAFNNAPQTPSFKLMDGNKELEYGKDYVCTFCKNTAPGTATVYVTGIGNYYGTQVYSFSITKASASNFTVAVDDAFYTGKALTPAVTVTGGSRTLVSGVDYTVAYSNNINIGTNTAVVTITGIGSYTGQKVVNFSIVENTVVAVTGIQLDKTTATVAYDSTVTITATVLPADAANKTVTWTTSGSGGTITVSADGTRCTVKGTGSGTLRVTATTQDGSHSETCTVTVTMSFWQRIIAFFRSLFGLV